MAPINPASQDAAVYAALRAGFKESRASATLPQTTATPYFTVAGGRVLAFFLGEVTVVIQTQANNTKLVHNPTVGTDSDMCAVLSITADEVGILYTLTGTVGDALVGGGQAGGLGSNPFVLNVGTVDLNCAASNTGETKWECFWVPLDDGATVTAA